MTVCANLQLRSSSTNECSKPRESIVLAQLKCSHKTSGESQSMADLEHRSGPHAAAQGGTVEVTVRIPDQTGVGILPVCRPGEEVQHGLLAGRIQLEHGALVEMTAVVGRTVEVAGIDPAQPRNGTASFRRSFDAPDHGLLARRRRSSDLGCRSNP